MRPFVQHVVMIWKRLRVREPGFEPVPSSRYEAPLRFSEFLAAASVPDVAGLPIEFWPAYPDLAVIDHEAGAAAASNRSCSPNEDAMDRRRRT